MEDNNESKSYYMAIFFTIFATVGIVLLIIFGGLAFTYSDKKINMAYISIPGKESCIKEVKHYDVYNNGGMISLTLADGTEITTSTKNVVLLEGRK